MTLESEKKKKGRKSQRERKKKKKEYNNNCFFQSIRISTHSCPSSLWTHPQGFIQTIFFTGHIFCAFSKMVSINSNVRTVIIPSKWFIKAGDGALIELSSIPSASTMKTRLSGATARVTFIKSFLLLYHNLNQTG